MGIGQQLTEWLSKNGGTGIPVPPAIMDGYLAACKQALEEMFVDKPRFPRVSNLGQDPLLLWLKKNHPEIKEYINPRMRMTFFNGKIVEAGVVAMLLMAGLVRPEQLQVKGKFTIDGIPDPIPGTCDLDMDDGVLDIKTAHDIAYNTKWDSVETLAENDDYNYMPQGYGYGRMLNKPFKGWLIINRNTGEWKDLLLDNDFYVSAERLQEKLEKDMHLAYQKERPPLPEPQVELYKGEPTGNIRVPNVWARSPYVHLLWPEAIEAKRGDQKIYYLEPFHGIKVQGIQLIKKK